ncbi:hypothetical protein ABT215_36610, partial [Streptomyces sp900105755]
MLHTRRGAAAVTVPGRAALLPVNAPAASARLLPAGTGPLAAPVRDAALIATGVRGADVTAGGRITFTTVTAEGRTVIPTITGRGRADVPTDAAALVVAGRHAVVPARGGSVVHARGRADVPAGDGPAVHRGHRAIVGPRHGSAPGLRYGPTADLRHGSAADPRHSPAACLRRGPASALEERAAVSSGSRTAAVRRHGRPRVSGLSLLPARHRAGPVDGAGAVRPRTRAVPRAAARGPV